MSLEVLYTVTPKSNVLNTVIIRDGVRIGTTPFQTSVRTTSLAQLGGTTSYIAEKTGYTSNIKYKLFLIRNPKFDFPDGNSLDRELQRVLLEYGDRAKNFNSTFNKTFPDFNNQNENTNNQSQELEGTDAGFGGYDPAFPNSGNNAFSNDFGDPLDTNPGITIDPTFEGEDTEPYSNVPIYVIAVLKYVDDILDENFFQLASDSNSIVFEYNLEAIEEEDDTPPPPPEPVRGCTDPNALNYDPLATEDDGSCEFEPNNLVRPLTVKSNLPSGINVVVNDDSSTTLSENNQILQVLDTNKIKILSSDIQRYRIKRIVRGEGKSSSVVAETADETKTVSFEFIVSKNEVFDVQVEEIPTTEPTPKPEIELIGDPNKKYNRNQPSTYFSFGIKKTKRPVESVRVVVGETVLSFSDLGSSDTSILNINTNLFTAIGTYSIQVIPFNQERGDGNPISFNVNVVNEVFVGVPDIRKLKYPETIYAPDLKGFNVGFSVSYESIDTDYIILSIEGSPYTSQISPTGKIDLNFQDLLSKASIEVDGEAESADIVLGLTPYNTSGIEEVSGKKELLTIKCVKGQNQISRANVINRFVDAFLNQVDFEELSSDTSKLLTHNLHVGDGENKVISNWLGSEGTLIAKLYEPLPTSIQENQQVWISKLQSNPIVETVTLSGDDALVCVPLKGPNFTLNVDKEGYGYKYYDELIGSGSATSDQIINRYFDGLNIDTTKLDIEYTSGSSYTFENFVNFGSAEERINNFYYKVQLIERYVSKLNELNDSLELGQILTERTSLDATIDGYKAVEPVLFTDDEIFTLDVEQRVYRNPSEKIEADKVINNLRTLLASFDGFENFLYKSTNELAYPKVTLPRPLTQYPITVLKSSLDPPVIAWLNSLLSLAREYDKNNVNYMVNNIPLFVKEDNENSEFLLFLDMIGQQFDVIWVYINALKKLRKNDEAGIKGVPKEFVHTILKSFGWDGLRAYDSQFLWEYALGQTKEGEQKYSTSLEDANNQIWKRILNNLPYLLKHKGTARSMKAIMATYGVPQTMLTIMEFGGPIDPEESGAVEFTFDDRTAALNMVFSSSVNIPWKSVGSEGYPDAIELMIKPHNLHSSTIVSSSGFQLDIVETGSKVYLDFNVGSETTQSVPFPYSTENYSGILINRNSTNYEVIYKTSDGQRVYVTSSLQLNTSSSADWESGDVVKFGNSFTGALDEVRLWRVPLEESKFENHVLFPNAINGNSYTSSTADLLVRLDFEYPVNFSTGTSTVPSESIKNVAINTSYSEDFATVSFFQNESSYPYNYIPYERTVTTKVPSLGYNYANKIRSEEQTLIGNLSHKKRATKGSFDRAPIDSSRLGLFFSPIKELNMDIVKSLGDFNIDNYIGNPADEYKSDYKELEVLRNYYFERLNRNTHEYIRLIKYISKSLFDVLESLAPARAKVSKGLLIEPHFLERSKTRWDKPNSLRNDFTTDITASQDVILDTDKKDYLGLLDAEQDIDLVGDERFYNTTLNVDEDTTLIADEKFYEGEIQDSLSGSFDSQYLVHTASIRFELTGSVQGQYDSFGSFTQVGMDPDSLYNLGFGLFAEDTTTIWKRLNDEDNTLTQSRSDVYLLEQTFTRTVPVQISGYPTIGSQEGDPVEIDVEEIPYVVKKINILPFNADAPRTDSLVTKVTPLKGYFPTHYRFVNGLSTGLERSFFEGSKQTINTTPDGLSPVETFETNPNILRVTDTGRGSGEPILEVDW